jgi:hypothetical protein
MGNSFRNNLQQFTYTNIPAIIPAISSSSSKAASAKQHQYQQNSSSISKAAAASAKQQQQQQQSSSIQSQPDHINDIQYLTGNHVSHI